MVWMALAPTAASGAAGLAKSMFGDKDSGAPVSQRVDTRVSAHLGDKNITLGGLNMPGPGAAPHPLFGQPTNDPIAGVITLAQAALVVGGIILTVRAFRRG